jgi:cytochrome d ubiquinol oxidase subunit I
MKVLLDRWQFGVTITYHFLFVPLTIGLAFLVAIMQVLAYRRRDEVWERLTRFFGTLFLINFAMGVVTGIVQEFQFGMNWSNYSVFVGNIFGAPLAMEGLLAFFAESTFIALWMFGRNRLPPPAHTLSICVVSLGTIVSAFFILTANAWMQHPVGYRIVGNKAELTDFLGRAAERRPDGHGRDAGNGQPVRPDQIPLPRHDRAPRRQRRRNGRQPSVTLPPGWELLAAGGRDRT